MATSDALYVVEDWISEHYFIADDRSGTFTARARSLMDSWRTAGDEDPHWRSPRERFTSARTALVAQLVALQAEAAALGGSVKPADRREALAEASVASADLLRTLLGYQDPPADGGAPVIERWDVATFGPLRRFSTRGVDEAPLAMLDALAAEDVADVLAKSAGHLPADVVLGEGTADEQVLTTVPQVLSALAVDRDAPEFMLVLAGRYAILTSARLWPQGRYLVADLQTIAERNDVRRGGEVERMLAALSADSLAPDASSQIWWSETIAESIDNAVGVSEDLRDGVRESIEILANEVIHRRRLQGLEPLPDDQAQTLALQSLRYLYRILFLLYAEASPELGILPVGAPEYQAGYSVDRLRDIAQPGREVPLDAADGTYLYQSLDLLFTLINTGTTTGDLTDTGHDAPAQHGAGTLRFENLEADLFRPDRTALLDEVGLGNKALQQVLENLLLSREKKGKARGFISYVALGINQLGAVYESLMSYTGSFAAQELAEVARNGDPKNGSWMVPLERVDEPMRAHLVMVEDEVGQKVPRTYRHGEFVFRLSGRARQQSASYYSPEVITSFTVSQGLAELLDPVIADEANLPDGTEVFDDEDFDHQPIRRRRTTAAEILDMSICEPALGSGAFAIEAVRQLSTEYLTRRQDETGKRIDPEQYATELQRVKAYIALHNVYGVDLNPTAVELAEVSLWLDTMAPGLKAPWFGLRLRAGNSLIGARHAVYSAEALTSARLKAVIESAPESLPVTTVHDDPAADGKRSSVSGKVFYFLLPGEGWLAAARDTEIKKLAPDAAKTLRDHAKGYAKKLTKPQVNRLEVLTQRVEELWGLALRRITEAENLSRRAIPVWGAETHEGGDVTRKQIEASLADANSAYRRLRLVMDAWCALWFWPVLPDDEITPPTVEEWISTLEQILGRSLDVVKHKSARHDPGTQQGALGRSDSWYELDTIEVMFSVGGAANIDTLLRSTPWLQRATRIAAEQRFFHWELDFAAAFDRGGFDLQAGNPPWVHPGTPISSIVAELDPIWHLAQSSKGSFPEHLAADKETLSFTLAERSFGIAESRFVSSESQYGDVGSGGSDLYHSFIIHSLASANLRGVSALVHPPGHLSVKGLSGLKTASFRTLRRLWSFRNEEKLFREIGNTRPFAVNIYGQSDLSGFLFAYPLFVPDTAIQSLKHDGAGAIPVAVDANGKRNMAPHRGRIKKVAAEDLRAVSSTMRSIGQWSMNDRAPRLPSSMDAVTFEVYAHIAGSQRARDLNPRFCGGIDEGTLHASGNYVRNWGEVSRWEEYISQGPNVDILNPAFQDRGSGMGSHRDYSVVDLQEVVKGRLPATEYKPAGSLKAPLPGQDGTSGGGVKAGATGFTLVWRRRVDPTTARTLQAAILPPGGAHVAYMHSAHGLAPLELVDLAGSAATIVSDFFVRSFGVGNIYADVFGGIPIPDPNHPLVNEMRARVLLLNCVHSEFAPLWSEVSGAISTRSNWTRSSEVLEEVIFPVAGKGWSSACPLTIAEARRQALLELDSLMAIILGIDVELLVAIYRQHFGTLWKYDHGIGANPNIFDLSGNLVISSVRNAWNKAGRPETGLPLEDRTAVHPSATGTGRTIVYEQPFRILDREADMRRAYAEFQRRLGEAS